MGEPLPTAILERPAEYDSNTTAECMFDGATASFWATPQGAAMPQAIALQIFAEAVVDEIVFDARIAGYETCAPRDVSIELALAGGDGSFVPAARATLAMGAIGSIRIPPLGAAEAIRVVFHSNHGGAVLAVNELRVMGSPLPVANAKQASGGFGVPKLSAKTEFEGTKQGWEPPKQGAWDEPNAGKIEWAGNKYSKDPNDVAMTSTREWSEKSDGKSVAIAEAQGNEWDRWAPEKSESEASAADKRVALAAGKDAASQSDWDAARGLRVKPKQESTTIGWSPPVEGAWDDPSAGKSEWAGGAVYQPGQRVVAQRADGGFYGATIVQASGGACEVKWDDGAPGAWLQVGQIQQA